MTEADIIALPSHGASASVGSSVFDLFSDAMNLCLIAMCVLGFLFSHYRHRAGTPPRCGDVAGPGWGDEVRVN
jgi:hypothetical protein